MDLVPLEKEPEKAPLPLPLCENAAKGMGYEPGGWVLTDCESSSASVLNFPVSSTLRN